MGQAEGSTKGKGESQHRTDGHGDEKIAVCFVCLGNICRSPTALGVMRALVKRAGVADRYVLDSAGTAGYHAGELSDRRSREAALRRGMPIEHRARQVTTADFWGFDFLLAMDGENLAGLERVAARLDGPARAKVQLFRSFDPTAPKGAEVPDPYYGGEEGFETVLDMCERACAGLIEATIGTRRAH